MSPMPAPPNFPIKPYIITGKVQYLGLNITGAKIYFTNETVAGSNSITSTEIDSNFAYDIANLSAWTNENTILIAATKDGKHGQKRVIINSANFGENIGIITLKTHWGCPS